MMFLKKRSLLLCAFFFSCLINHLSFSTNVKNRKIEITDLSSFNLLKDNLSFSAISGNKNDEISFLESLKGGYNDDVENVEDGDTGNSDSSDNNGDAPTTNNDNLDTEGNGEVQEKTSESDAALSESDENSEVDPNAKSESANVEEDQNVTETTTDNVQAPDQPFIRTGPTGPTRLLFNNPYNNVTNMEETDSNPDTVETAAVRMASKNKNKMYPIGPFQADVQPYDLNLAASGGEQDQVLTNDLSSEDNDDSIVVLDETGSMSPTSTTQTVSSHANTDVVPEPKSESNVKRRRKFWPYNYKRKNALGVGEKYQDVEEQKESSLTDADGLIMRKKTPGTLSHIKNLFTKIKEKVFLRFGNKYCKGAQGYSSKCLEKEKQADETVPLLSLDADQDTSHTSTVMFTEEKIPMINYHMGVLGVTDENRDYGHIIINLCEDKRVEVSGPLTINKMLSEFMSKRELFYSLEANLNICLANTFERGYKLQDKTLNKGTLLGTINRLDIPKNFIIRDLAMVPGLEIISDVNSSVTFQFFTTSKEKLFELNYCLVHPINLSKILQLSKDTIVASGSDFMSLYNFAMEKSILCHLDAVFNDSGNEISNVERLKNIKLFIKSLKKGFNRNAKRVLNKTVSMYMSNYTDNISRCKTMEMYRDNFIKYYMLDVLNKTCESFHNEDNYWVALAEVTNYVKALKELIEECLHNLYYYNAIMDKLRKFIKLVMTYILRNGAFSCFHINYLLSQYAKSKKLSQKQLPVAPVPSQYDNNSVYQMALYVVRRLSHLQIVHDFFECKKTDLADVMTRVKTAITQYSHMSKMPQKKKSNTLEKNVLSVIKKYKRILRKKFNEIRLQYLAILKIRYEEQWEKNFFLIRY